MRAYACSIALLSLLIYACSPISTSLPAETPTPSAGGGESSTAADSSGSAPDDSARTDTSTGLFLPPIGTAPSGVPAPANSVSGPLAEEILLDGTATIAISGELPLMLTGGTCTTVDGETYVSVPPVYDAPPPYASLVIYEASDESNLRGGYLVWASSDVATDSASTSAQNLFVITLNNDHLSGRFSGTAERVNDGVPVQREIEIDGVFNCVAGLMRVGGNHPADFAGAECITSPQFVVRSGTRGQNAVFLQLEEGARSGEPARGGLSWRVGGVEYSSNWLTVTLNHDAISGTYHGEASNPDGSIFIVQGSFNCLGM